MEEGKDPNATNVPKPNQSRLWPQGLVDQLLFVFIVLCFSLSLFVIYMTRQTSVTTTTLISSVPISQPCAHLKEQPETNLDHWIESPLNMLHTMSDKELFWRASLVPQLKNCSFTRVPKIAFMFLTKGPLPLAPLWERFFKGHEGRYSIYIHSLPSYEAKFEPTSVFHGRQIPSQVVEWGTMSMCDAERRLIANALLDISNEYFVLLSESCIPLYNFTLTYRYITNSEHSFMGAFDDPSSVGRGRYNYRMSPQVKLSQWRKGSQWFEIHRNLAYLIISDTTYYPVFKEHCRPACYVDEHYFPTMLSIQAPESLANRSLTWVDWSRGGPHPATFGKSDITEQFIKNLRRARNCYYNGQPSEICYLFARKFSPGSLEALLSFAFTDMGY
ncbi:core-2/I-branching beta-1,6-N-acetylglucosaminyltransferase family protein [Artemisia annua]|uniref:Core-2/I-branching beta-1,6-N-acetylglucosaminyltransferase family protein n=1 Tax=Artemisia annua TaxID=35608 RepID=A0A2U1Q870_ARTAN|nr:core-2/I-branching beta-1,6-N-acetylglucosaminyltransferase family protein [Artemisia annua]